MPWRVPLPLRRAERRLRRARRARRPRALRRAPRTRTDRRSRVQQGPRSRAGGSGACQLSVARAERKPCQHDRVAGEASSRGSAAACFARGCSPRADAGCVARRVGAAQDDPRRVMLHLRRSIAPCRLGRCPRRPAWPGGRPRGSPLWRRPRAPTPPVLRDARRHGRLDAASTSSGRPRASRARWRNPVHMRVAHCCPFCRAASAPASLASRASCRRPTVNSAPQRRIATQSSVDAVCPVRWCRLPRRTLVPPSRDVER